MASQPPKPTCHTHVRHAYLFFRKVSPRYVIIDLRVDRIKCTSQQQCDYVSKFFYQSCLDLVGLPPPVLMMLQIFEAEGGGGMSKSIQLYLVKNISGLVTLKMEESKISFVLSLYFNVWRLDCWFQRSFYERKWHLSMLACQHLMVNQTSNLLPFRIGRNKCTVFKFIFTLTVIDKKFFMSL